ncbi:hypothetical protein KII97_02580 [Leuconostoc gelidum subsp. gasicomitatum]|uniref:hypothetical protein n=1 Tax=Leuconostoc gasicomitatum TaxID=115778 RepID=UPI001CC421E3|nr:hypothetical protein [Leuconostoc gasicomitatum]MBZ5995394.1 hypothetical protein [Leuconostoc gasicomitatum]
MEQKVGIYFYKNIFCQRKYIATSTIKNAQDVDMILSFPKEKLSKKVPKINLGTYLLIDGKVFKL